MQKIINGKLYNTDTAKTLVSTSCYSNGNYAGSDTLMAAPGGKLMVYCDSNGQDCYRQDTLQAITKDQALDWLDGCEVTDVELDKLAPYFGFEEA